MAIPEAEDDIGSMVKCHSTLADVNVEYCNMKNTSISVMVSAIMPCILDVLIYSIAIARLRTLHVQRNKRMQLIVVLTLSFL